MEEPAVSTASTKHRSERKHGQARRDELREIVLASVERHLRAGTSFAEINVTDLVSESGISRSTFYAYFIDKGNLLRTWYAEFNLDILAAAREWWSLDGSAGRADLKRALWHIIDAHRPHPELLAATHEVMGADSGVRDAVEQAMRQYIEGLRTHIETGQREGFIDPALPPAQTAYWLQWMAERGLHMMAHRPGGELSQMLEAYTAIVWNALYAPVRRS